MSDTSVEESTAPITQPRKRDTGKNDTSLKPNAISWADDAEIDEPLTWANFHEKEARQQLQAKEKEEADERAGVPKDVGKLPNFHETWKESTSDGQGVRRIVRKHKFYRVSKLVADSTVPQTKKLEIDRDWRKRGEEVGRGPGRLRRVKVSPPRNRSLFVHFAECHIVSK